MLMRIIGKIGWRALGGLVLGGCVLFAGSARGEESNSLSAAAKPKSSINAVHPALGESIKFGGDRVVMRLDAKLQNFMGGTNPPRDPDIASPKSVNIHPTGTKFYVNSLEGGKTLVYSLPEMKKLAAIDHTFGEKDAPLWAPESGFFKFRHYSRNLGSFMGKPVESAFSHGGRYLWVPYYRRSFDLNAQDPSAVAVIDTKEDKIVRLMEAGVLPKMIALSPDGKTMAITHWGDNTVGLIDVSGEDPNEWKYKGNVAVGRQLFHNFSLTTAVNRDSNTGEALRGTVFTPDGRFLLVGCMSGGGIAVIDVARQKYLGKLLGSLPNLRHLVINGDKLYASINASGYVERIPMARVMEGIAHLDGSGNFSLSGWERCKVDAGARTLELSPKGDFIFVACNAGSAVCVVDSSMNLVGRIAADSYPVGLDISPDGKWLITTSQGRKNAGGGNCVDIFSLSGLESDFDTAAAMRAWTGEPDEAEGAAIPSGETDESTTFAAWLKSGVGIAVMAILAVCLIAGGVFFFCKKQKNS